MVALVRPAQNEEEKVLKKTIHRNGSPQLQCGSCEFLNRLCPENSYRNRSLNPLAELNQVN